MNKTFIFFSKLSLVLVLLVILAGSLVRMTGSGMGCPDWPGCYGFVFWPNDEAEIALAESRFPMFPYDINKAIPEQVHRIFAASLGVIAIILVALSSNTQSKSIQRWSIFLLVLICCQGLFGYLTVSLKLLPIIVTIHLFGGFATLTLLYFIYLKSRNFEILNQINISHLKTIASVAMAVLIFQIFLGVWTSTNYASLACADFPTCQGSYLPEMDFKNGFNLNQEVGPNYLYGLLDNNARVAIHFTHRIWAILVIIVFFIFSIKLKKTKSN